LASKVCRIPASIGNRTFACDQVGWITSARRPPVKKAQQPPPPELAEAQRVVGGPR
jgi:hypothetical protein